MLDSRPWFPRALLCTAVLIVSSCASPLVSRRARVLQPAQVEVQVVPNVGVFGAAGEAVVGPYPSAELTLRVGVLPRTDLMLRLDPTIFPELDAAVQIIGDPAKNELALTLGAGAKFGMLPAFFPNEAVTMWSFPLQLLCDLPLTEDVTLISGVRLIPDIWSVGPRLAPGASVGVEIAWGPLMIRPELAGHYAIPLKRTSDPAIYSVALGLGLGDRTGDDKEW